MFVQSGLSKRGQKCAMECVCYLRDVLGFLADDTTAYETRFSAQLNGPTMPRR